MNKFVANWTFTVSAILVGDIHVMENTRPTVNVTAACHFARDWIVQTNGTRESFRTVNFLQDKSAESNQIRVVRINSSKYIIKCCKIFLSKGQN